uniref:RRM domain-containing protein n=1 Tax=Heterorhabditis bacteriophora TaxID=37862 RepID=A0A1I7X227_HETBA
MNYIDNDLADELMKIEDKYGENKKIEGEKVSFLMNCYVSYFNFSLLLIFNQLQQLLADVKHFNYTPIRPVGECIRGRGGAVGIPLGRPINAFPPLAPVVPRMMMGPRGPMLPGLPPGMPPIIPPESAGGPSLGVLRGRGAMTMRGRSAPLGVRSGLFATKLNRIQSSAESGTEVEERIEAQVADENRAVLSENTGGEKEISALSVIMINPLPFRFPVDENSVRMRMGDDGVPTGECMLAIRDPESARNAVSSLAGKCLRGQKVFMHLANP